MVAEQKGRRRRRKENLAAHGSWLCCKMKLNDEEVWGDSSLQCQGS